MGPEFDLIIFDCDGTLVDSEYLNNKITSDLLIELGLTDYTPEKCIADFAGVAWSNIRQTLVERHGSVIPDDVVKRYIRTVQERMPDLLKPVPDSLDVVTGLKDHITLCVGSNGERSNVMQSLSLSGFDEIFHDANIFTKIQVEQPKPHPDLFLFAAEQMGFADPSRILVIEDSPTGVQAGKAAGMQTWGFTGVAHDKETQHKALEKAGADRVFDRLIHMPEMLGL